MKHWCALLPALLLALFAATAGFAHCLSAELPCGRSLPATAGCHAAGENEVALGRDPTGPRPEPEPPEREVPCATANACGALLAAPAAVTSLDALIDTGVVATRLLELESAAHPLPLEHVPRAPRASQPTC